MAENKNKAAWIRTAIMVGVIFAGIITSYITLQSEVEMVKKDTAKVEIKTENLDNTKLDKETFAEYKLRQEKEFDEFKTNQKATTEKLHSIDLKMVTIEEQLRQILKAVNKQ